MAIAGVGAAQATQGSTSVNLTRTAGAVNNVLVVSGDVASNGATPSITDTQGNTWNVLNTAFHDATNASSQVTWYAFAKNTSSTTVTVAGNGGAIFTAMTLEEFSGISLSNPVDVTTHSTAGATGTPTSPSFTPAANDELVWTFVSDNVTAVGNIDGSAATKGGDDGVGDWTEYRILAGRSGISMTAAFTGSGAYDLCLATFRPATVGYVRPFVRPFPFTPGSPRQ